MLKEVGFRLGLKDIMTDKVGNSSAAKKQQGEKTKTFLQVRAKQLIYVRKGTYLQKESDKGFPPFSFLIISMYRNKMRPASR